MNKFKKGDKVKIKREDSELSTVGQVASIMKDGTVLVHAYGTRGTIPFNSDGKGKHGLYYIEMKS